MLHFKTDTDTDTVGDYGSAGVREFTYRFGFNPEPHVESISPAVEQILGYSPDDFFAEPMLALRIAHPEDAEKLCAVMAQPPGSSEPSTLRYIARDGSTVWAEHRMRVVYDESGEVEAIEGDVRDVSEQYAATTATGV